MVNEMNRTRDARPARLLPAELEAIACLPADVLRAMIARWDVGQLTRDAVRAELARREGRA